MSKITLPPLPPEATHRLSDGMPLYTAEQLQADRIMVAEHVIRACAQIVEAQTARGRRLYAAMNAEPVAACQHAAALVALLPVKEPKE